jgi:hypothetical protein
MGFPGTLRKRLGDLFKAVVRRAACQPAFQIGLFFKHARRSPEGAVDRGALLATSASSTGICGSTSIERAIWLSPSGAAGGSSGSFTVNRPIVDAISEALRT